MSLPYLQPYLGLSNGLNTLHGGAAGGGVGGWVELARTTLGSASDNLNVTSLPDKRYYMVLGDFKATGGSISPDLRLNSDTGSNYSDRYCANGGADATATSIDFIRAGIGLSTPFFNVGYLANYSSKEKLYLGHLTAQSTAGAGTAPQRVEMTGKHAQTSNPISAVNYIDRQSGQFASGSEVVVLGYDPLDSHTNNFWEELYSGEQLTSVTTFDTGTIATKKYLWIQLLTKNDALASATGFQFNSDTGNNYSFRYNINGGADATLPNNNKIQINVNNTNQWDFANVFIINNASNEKLMILHEMDLGSSTGAGNAPARWEVVGKWANTSAQISSIQIARVNQDFQIKAMKVWGAD